MWEWWNDRDGAGKRYQRIAELQKNATAKSTDCL
jgi:hypothetical protein